MHTRYKNVKGRLASSNVPVVVGGICGYTYQAKLYITNVIIDFLSTAIKNAGLIAGNRDALSLIYIKNVTSQKNTKFAKSKVNMYRCIYQSPPAFNLTILDYNTLPYGEKHIPGKHTTSCKYVWLLPFAEAAYQNAETLISPS